MAAVDDLLGMVDDLNLRSALEEEVRKLRNNKEFGLVFERHLPENVRLVNHPIRRGVNVQERNNSKSQTWNVASVKGEKITLRDPNGEVTTRDRKDLVVVKAFGDSVFPGIRSVGRISRGAEDQQFNLVLNGENYHALECFLFAYEECVDCIYIDPPYNTGARDWKYNNDYVDGNDNFRHSKWLSFMEKRLALAKRLLRPEDSVLLITIDDHEVYSLGLLLDQFFPSCERQMVSITISPRGKSRDGRLSQVDEYLLIVYIGSSSISSLSGEGVEDEIRWRYLRRNDIESARGTKKGGPRQFYPIYVDSATERIIKIGEPLVHSAPSSSVSIIPGAVAVLPIRDDSVEMNWGLTGPSLKAALDAGYVRVTKGTNPNQPYVFSYLTAPNIKKVAQGALKITGQRPDGSHVVAIPGGKAVRPTTAWRDTLYDAGAYGTSLLRSLIPGRAFPFPKSLYAVEDTLRTFLRDKPNALVVDFFAGSGTTGHALARLNKQDGGRRKFLLVTNNEVSDTEAQNLRSRGLQPGDADWEAMGIFQYVTMPRIVAAISGQTPDGVEVEGEYKGRDPFPISEGFEENVEFLELDYLDRNDVSRGKSFEAIAPLLWMKVGAIGPRVDREEKPFAIPNNGCYGVLFTIDSWRAFADELDRRPEITHAFVVTDSLAQFQEVASEFPPSIKVSMLWEDYLRNFEINTGGSS